MDKGVGQPIAPSCCSNSEEQDALIASSTWKENPGVVSRCSVVVRSRTTAPGQSRRPVYSRTKDALTGSACAQPPTSSIPHIAVPVIDILDKCVSCSRSPYTAVMSANHPQATGGSRPIADIALGHHNEL